MLKTLSAKEVVAPVAFASMLATNMSRWFGKCDPPAITYATNGSDTHGNLLNEVIRASIEALIRGWRHEDETLQTAGELDWAVRPNQLVRYDSETRTT
jgi:malonyl-CoA reductase/3-hydroxypropionate dehydrogenase (NADP+)